MTTTKKAAPKRSMDLVALEAKTKPILRSVPMCLDGGLFARHDELEQELEQLAQAAEEANKLNDPAVGKAKKVAQEIIDLETEMRKHSYTFVFKGISGDVWEEMITANPPREKNTQDARYGANMRLFAPLAVKATCVDPQGMEDDAVFDRWWSKLTDGQQWTLFFNGAHAANRSTGEVPKSETASDLMKSFTPKSDSA